MSVGEASTTRHDRTAALGCFITLSAQNCPSLTDRTWGRRKWSKIFASSPLLREDFDVCRHLARQNAAQQKWSKEKKRGYLEGGVFLVEGAAQGAGGVGGAAGARGGGGLSAASRGRGPAGRGRDGPTAAAAGKRGRPQRRWGGGGEIRGWGGKSSRLAGRPRSPDHPAGLELVVRLGKKLGMGINKYTHRNKKIPAGVPAVGVGQPLGSVLGDTPGRPSISRGCGTQCSREKGRRVRGAQLGVGGGLGGTAGA